MRSERNEHPKADIPEDAPAKVIETPEQELELLSAEVAQLSAENAILVTRLRERYVALLKSDGFNDLFRQEIVSAKKAFEKRVRAIKPIEDVPLGEEKAIVLDACLDDESIIPKRDRDIFVAYFEQLPPTLQKKYSERLRTVFKNKDEVAVITNLLGAVFEMSRTVTVMRQGLEDVHVTEEKRALTVTYSGYEKRKSEKHTKDATKAPSAPDAPDYTLAPTKEIKDAPIELDVFLRRGGNPYILETKSYPRMRYGSDVQARNQILKYQAAIDQGIVAGATVEIRGRIDHAFLDWAIGEKIDDHGHAPDVEIIYTFDLPSGKEYRFVLKQTKGADGLKFHNEAHYDEDDQLIIRGIQQSLADKRIIGIITDVNIDPVAASDELRPLLDDPMQITKRRLFEEYDRLRSKGIVDTLKVIADSAKINKENKKSAVSEYAKRDFVEHLVRELQDFLKQNPALAAAKSAYVLKPEQVPLAVERTLAAVEKIREYELARAGSANEAAQQAQRQALGYTGLPEGVALDIDHIMMDAIFSITKAGYDRAPMEKGVGKENLDLFFFPSNENPNTLIFKFRSEGDWNAALALPEGSILKAAYEKMSQRQKEQVGRLIKEAAFVRSYDWPERFVSAGQLPEMLNTEDRRYLELQVFDPLATEKAMYDRKKISEVLGAEAIDLLFVSPAGADAKKVSLKYKSKERLLAAMDESGNETLKSTFGALKPKQQEYLDGLYAVVTRQTDTTEQEIEKTRNNIVRENIERAERYIAGTKRKNQNKSLIVRARKTIKKLELDRDQTMSGLQQHAQEHAKECNTQAGQLKKDRADLAKNGGSENQLAEIDTNIQHVEQERAKAFDVIRVVSAEYQEKILTIYKELSNLYRHIVPEAEWKTFAKRETKKIDENIIKFIYAVTSDGKVIVQEEVIRGDVSGRAAHSELAQGRNIYGAGELAFEKKNGQWMLTEINNGSGHYRPDAISNLDYVKNLLHAQGMDVSQARLTDSILRGIKLKDVSAF
ncbi:MAG: hypothetical protein HY981_01925 [Candidatus Magasanikbacteria bacterium]|nr:hypothetical protein [Candidatus Magasanikbacteria bacterium]